MDRREFIILASATAGLALLSACGAADSVAPTIDPNGVKLSRSEVASRKTVVGWMAGYPCGQDCVRWRD